MAVQIPPILVLIVCKTISAGGPDENARFTGYKDLEWATEHSMMVCRRTRCSYSIRLRAFLTQTTSPRRRSIPTLRQTGNALELECRSRRIGTCSHRNSGWRVWRVGCPAPIVDTRTGALIGYKLPECGHRETVICEVDFGHLAASAIEFGGLSG